MKIPFAVGIVSLSLLTAVVTTSAVAAPKKTETEETRGAAVGLVVGAVVGGPIGAGVGAMVGGAVLGKLVGYHRINRELESEMISLAHKNK